MRTDFMVFLDAGHGGILPNGQYATAPGKQWKHANGTFHRDGWFYEGVWNRTLVNRVSDKLHNLQIQHIIVSHEYLDTPLDYRVDLANWYGRRVARTLFFSTHSNAIGNGRARGFELYTSPGRTTSDTVADQHFNNVRELVGDRIRYRSDQSDSDYDKEARFYVLTQTSMAAVLVEHLFFDNYEDALLLMDPDIVERFAEAQVRTIIDFMRG
jgi:N-acetylmuramoyl-L-alanine amidase